MRRHRQWPEWREGVVAALQVRALRLACGCYHDTSRVVGVAYAAEARHLLFGCDECLAGELILGYLHKPRPSTRVYLSRLAGRCYCQGRGKASA